MQDNKGNIISRSLEHTDESNNDKKYKAIIIATNKMLSNLKNNQINEYFMDCTYKMVPPNKNNFRLMVICGYDTQKRKTCLCLFALLMNEKEFTFSFVFNHLKNEFSFNPRNFMADFAMGQINL